MNNGETFKFERVEKIGFVSQDSQPHYQKKPTGPPTIALLVCFGHGVNSQQGE